MAIEIHPRIGVARLGNSLGEFYLAPETIGGLPVACDEWGNEEEGAGPVRVFKDEIGAIKRQAAKFRLFSTNKNGECEEISLETPGIAKIEWVAHIANKKPVWYTFSELLGDLEFGPDNSYEATHVPLNNPAVTDSDDRQKLIIDPGPRSVSEPNSSVAFSRYNIPSDYAHGSFPPVSAGGQQIDVLGELKMDAKGNLVALGGFGRVTGSAQIDSFRGAAGYWDDISDGYVFARVTTEDGEVIETDSAWLLVGSPKFVPEITNIVTLADTMEDVAIRKMGSRPDIYSGDDTADAFPSDNGYCPLNGFNPEYTVNFDRDVRPIIDRPALYKYVANVPTMDEFSRPGFDVRDASEGNLENRMRYFNYFRVPLLPKDYAEVYPQMSKGPAQLYADDGIPLMPLNSGDNSVTNIGPIYKFLTLSPTLYFYLFQWAVGNFTTEPPKPLSLPQHLDQVDVGNCVGGPFSPGIEVTWSTRSEKIYETPLQLKLAHTDIDGYAGMSAFYRSNGLTPERNECLGGGCEPGDLTKRMAIPWMADFHECTVQTPNITDINVNQLTDGSGIEVPPAFYVYWWPPQSPFNVMTGTPLAQDQVLDAYVSDIDGQPIIPAGQNVEYQRGIDSAQQMIQSWASLGFIINRGTEHVPYMVETERNFGQLAQAKLNAEAAKS
ncbi:MAG: CTQ-dependent lysine 6-oxidase LodA [Pseudomonadota bacterium]